MANDIAMGFQGVQLQNPLDMYAKVMGIQNARNQNAMAQYTLGAAQRDDADQNSMRAFLPTLTEENQNQLLQYGKTGKATFEAVLKGRKEAMEASKMKAELIDTKLKQSRAFLDTIDPNSPDAPQLYMQWHEANHADPVLGPTLAQRGITAEQSRARIAQASQTPGGFAQLLNMSKLGTDKFMEMNKLHFSQVDNGKVISQVATPGLGGTPTITALANKTTTPDADQSNQTTIRGQNLTKDAADARIAAKPDDPKLKFIPAHVNTAIIKNSQSLNKVDQAIGLLSGKDEQGNPVEGADKNATGLKGYLPNAVLQRAYPEGVTTRAIIADIGSLKLHDRSGAAVTASEFPRLAPFIPAATDKPSVALAKLKLFKKALAEEQEALSQTYSEEQGYRPSPVGRIPTPGATTAPTSVQPAAAPAPQDPMAALDAEVRAVGPKITPAQLQAFSKRLQAINGGAAPAARSPTDQQALDWATANPTDPRAAQIKSKLGVK